MLAAAAEAGATAIDTAAAYGASEAVIGAALAADAELRVRMWVITKLAPGAESDEAGEVVADPGAAAVRVRAAVDESRRRLRLDRLPLLLLHRSAARLAARGAVWDTLRALVGQGAIGGLGVSVYAPEEALDALGDPDVGAIQLPMSVLDRRMAAAGVLDLCHERGVAVFARSVFLQGALATPDVPTTAYPAALKPYIERFHGEAARLGRSGASLALAYVRSVEGPAGLVVGAESVAQVRDNAGLFEMAPLTSDERRSLEEAIGTPDDDLVDISRWELPPA
jgi:aryl-alcohol dehydrogenase-like predicted oxidoreductase